MAESIQFFLYVQKIYRIVGIYPPSKCHGQRRFTAKTTFILACIILGFISTFVYFLFEANSIDEYGRSFYISFAKLEGLLYFVVNLSKIESISNLIKKLEDFIKQSELEKMLEFRLFEFKICIDADVWFIWCEIGAQSSASTSVYEEMNAKIEKFSKRLYQTLMGLIILTILLPAICVGLVNYYILDMKKESFDLPIPMTYVRQKNNLF